MSLAEKLKTLAENEQRVFGAGKKAEQTEFWEVFQVGGKRTFYDRFCSDNSFNDETYNPLYPITVHNAYVLFSYRNNTNLVTDTKVPIVITSGHFNYCFNESPVKVIRSIDFTNCTSTAAPFYLATELEEITVVGTIKVNLEFLYSKKLTHESLMSIIHALYDFSDDSSGAVHTLKLGPENLAKLIGAEKDIITQKGWQYS